ncbi:MAG: DEAD/DEAH box helicase [bacterium]|nr:DEAD/DEAH box helicase [bacterium]
MSNEKNVNEIFAEFRLDPRLQKAVVAAGYETATPIQSKAIPLGLERRDLIATAQTGTGKTAAFVLPILQDLLDNPSRGKTATLILTPTRELAEQINDNIRQLGRFTSIKSATVYGGVGMIPQERALRGGAEIIVACPGRFLDHMGRGNTRLSGIRTLVLDEADRMLDMGFLPSIKRILTELPRERQTMLFSATFAPELNKLAEGTLRNPARIDMDLHAPAKTVTHVLYTCHKDSKTELLLKLLAETDTNSVLIFTRTKHRANRLMAQIAGAGYGTTVLHSNKSQNQRQLALQNFRSGKCQILVATDIAARGLDIATISHVINYDIPDTADAYIHRIGRTGRAEADGDALTLVTYEDEATIAAIERAIGSRIERRRMELPGFRGSATVAAPRYSEPAGYSEPGRYSEQPARRYSEHTGRRRSGSSRSMRAPM